MIPQENKHLFRKMKKLKLYILLYVITMLHGLIWSIHGDAILVLKLIRIDGELSGYLQNYIWTTKHLKFKFKLLHGILPNKIMLHRWKLAMSPACNICGQIESYEHLFIQCRNMEAFWANALECLKQMGFNINKSRLMFFL